MNNRVEMLNGELVPWTTKSGTPMKIAATAPEYPGPILAQALEPNGSWLDYVTNRPTRESWATTNSGSRSAAGMESLYLAGAALGLLRTGPR